MSPSDLKPTAVPAEADVPSFPAIANAILRLAARDDVTLEEVAEVIAADGVIAAEVLRMANSAFVGARGEVRSIIQAATLLGLKRVSGIAASVAMRSSLGHLWRKPVVRQCWQHNLASALTAEQMARWLNLDPQAAYTSGLLHDIGRLGLLMRHQDEYATFLMIVATDDVDFLQVERERFGIDHTDMGQRMIAALGLSGQLSRAAEFHHRVATSPSGDFSAFIHVACELSSSMGFGVRAPHGAGAGTVDLDRILFGLPERSRAELTSRHASLTDMVTSMVEAYDRALT